MWVYPKLRTEKRAKIAANLLHVHSSTIHALTHTDPHFIFSYHDDLVAALYKTTMSACLPQLKCVPKLVSQYSETIYLRSCSIRNAANGVTDVVMRVEPANSPNCILC